MENEVALWKRVALKDPQEDLTLQISDLGTAIDFWNMYRQTSEELLHVTTSLELQRFSSVTSENVAHMIPDERWYTSPEHAKSVHGTQHAARVAFYSEILGQGFDLKENERKILLAASLIHDIARENDVIDPNHGWKSVKRWRELGDILVEKGITLSDKERVAVEILCTFHENPYREIPIEVKSDIQIHKLLKIFMAADALDRYRLANEQYWPNAEFFSHDRQLQKIFILMMPFARHFTLWTEYYRLQNPSLSLEKVFIDAGQSDGLSLVKNSMV